MSPSSSRSPLRRPFAVAALALLLLAAAAAVHTAGAAAAYRFAVWGDVRPASTSWPTSQSAGFKHMVASLAHRRRSAQISVGDYINLKPGDGKSTVQAKYAAFKQTAAAILNKRTLYAIGNHEVVDGFGNTTLLESLFRSELGIKGDLDYRWLKIDKGRINVILLDTEMPGYMQHLGYVSETSGSNSPQAKWLVKTLKTIAAAHPKAWVIVADHRPIADPESGDALYNDAAERNGLKALFTKYGVDLVVCGDTHYYRRHVESTGPTYLVQGTGGAPSDAIDVAPIDSYDVAKDAKVFGYTLFRLKDGKLTGRTVEAPPSTWKFGVVDTFSVPNRPAASASAAAFAGTRTTARRLPAR